jgi:CubicO group peptidase (beta-lactamase class C family)
MTASAVSQLITGARVPGLSMAVIGDRQALTVCGVRNAIDRTAVDQQTIFGAVSLSKPLFAYAVLQLTDAGKLALDTPLSLHVPDYVADDPRAAAVTVRHVLSHTSGLPNWRSVDLPLKTYFAPGERFSYSGEGFVWLQRVVEAVTGESLDATLRRLIFDPLGMHRSSYIWQPAFEANYADPHDAEMEPGIKIKPSVPNTAASLQTTRTSLAFWKRYCRERGSSETRPASGSNRRCICRTRRSRGG